MPTGAVKPDAFVCILAFLVVVTGKCNEAIINVMMGNDPGVSISEIKRRKEIVTVNTVSQQIEAGSKQVTKNSHALNILAGKLNTMIEKFKI